MEKHQDKFNALLKTYETSIQRSKDDIQTVIDHAIWDFTKSLNRGKDKLFQELYDQLDIVKSNAQYSSCIIQYLKNKNSTVPTKSDLLNEFQSLKSVDELNRWVRMKKDGSIQLFANQSPKDIKEKLQYLIDEVEHICSKPPEIKIHNLQVDFKLLEKQILDNIQIKKFACFSGSGAFGLNNSAIFSQFSQISTLQTLCGFKGTLKLRYRGSRDGFTNAKFQKRMGDIKPTLTIVKSKKGNIFGGFTEDDWSRKVFEKKSLSAFIFNLDKNEKYWVDMDKFNRATEYKPGFILSFGDFAISENCDQHDDMKSFCKIGQNYLIGSSLNKLPCVDEFFMVEEVETFEVVLSQKFSRPLDEYKVAIEDGAMNDMFGGDEDY